ncbi:MAG: cobalamin-dependent protein [Deltaproteobacteria bacterium]|nr:cobalamin-dependent protein [Deltaproteobacteria bacterium]
MSDIRVALADFSYFNQFTQNTSFTPLNIGYLAAYLQKIFGPTVDIRLYRLPNKFQSDMLDFKPNIVGFSLYAWNADLVRVAVDYTRKNLGNECVIVLGGPSIDLDPSEQLKIFNKYPSVDALACGEGELALADIVRNVLATGRAVGTSPMDGIIYHKKGEIVAGNPRNYLSDLTDLPSPYLTGLLDSFLDGPYRPTLQTSRGCPYTCKYCSSGKYSLKLRSFPLEQIIQEIDLICDRYADRPLASMFIVDENFGRFEQDAYISEYIAKKNAESGYPRSLYYYTDKRFSETTKKVLLATGKLNSIGLTLALQSENEDTLTAVGRRNVSESVIQTAVDWASENNIQITTELIFGLPLETKSSFAQQLQKAVDRGFDFVLCHNLFLLPGMELNREEMRQKYGMQTKHRIVGPNYGEYFGKFVVESEEVVVENSTFNFDDYMIIRWLNFFFYTVYSLGFFKSYFNGLKDMGLSLVSVFERLHTLTTATADSACKAFFTGMEEDFRQELHSSREELELHMRKVFTDNRFNVAAPSRLAIYWGAKLIYMSDWAGEAIEKLVSEMAHQSCESYNPTIAQELLELSRRERINIRNPRLPDPLEVSYDYISWAAGKFKQSLDQFKLGHKATIEFSTDYQTSKMVDAFREANSQLTDWDFYYNVIDSITPRNRQLYKLKVV